MYKTINFRHDKVIIIGGGESLKGFDFTRLNDFPGAIISMNRVIDFLPRSDYWITIDMGADWWLSQLNKNPRCYYFAGIPAEKLEYHKNAPVHGLLRVPYFAVNKNEISGGNSGYAALNLAYHFEAKQILMLGLDCYGKGHWHPDDGILFEDGNPKCVKAVQNIPNLFSRSVEKFSEKSITVINGSIASLITCFPKLSIEDGLHWIGVK